MLTFVAKQGNGNRRVVKITVSGEGKEALTKVAERYGMKEYVVGGRVFEWFMAQDDLFQRAVLGLLEGLEVDAAARFMERLAEDSAKKPLGPQPNGAGRLSPRKAVRTAAGDLKYSE